MLEAKEILRLLNSVEPGDLVSFLPEETNSTCFGTGIVERINKPGDIIHNVNNHPVLHEYHTVWVIFENCSCPQEDGACDGFYLHTPAMRYRENGWFTRLIDSKKTQELEKLLEVEDGEPYEDERFNLILED